MNRIIAAVSSNGVIGKDGAIPFYYSEDLKHFKSMTLNQTIVMGRKTYDSIGKPLPNRKNIVVTSGLPIEGTLCFNDLHAAMRNHDDDVWIIGGNSLYQFAMDNNYCDEIVLTLTPDIVTGDNLIKFPWINPTLFALKSMEKFPNKSLLIKGIYMRIKS